MSLPQASLIFKDLLEIQNKKAQNIKEMICNLFLPHGNIL